MTARPEAAVSIEAEERSVYRKRLPQAVLSSTGVSGRTRDQS